MNNKKALITGITGQSGSHLADLLLEKDYEVHGIIRRCSSFNTSRIDHIYDRIKLHYGDLTDPLVISNLISEIQPDEVYNLAIIDFILKSKENAEEFMNYGMNNLRFRNHVRKNNKLIKCECYLPITSACESLEIIK